MRVVEFTYQKNARDIGGMVSSNGKKVKTGLIFRGGSLAHVSSSDIEKIKSLGITDIVDFRGKEEFEHKPDYKFENVEFHNFPTMKMKEDDKNIQHEDSNLLFFLNDTSQAAQHMMNLYSDSVISDIGKVAYRNFFNLLMQNNKVIYFHCSQGKDRAGLAAYLLEIALGIDPISAREDYLYSNVAMEAKIVQLKNMVKDKKFYNREYEIAMDHVFTARNEYLDQAINSIEKNFGSILNYLEKELGVDIKHLREKYLD
ncbi:MAG: tyrosine-protein phosphatase [Bacilli bacterium]|nr:tyrosine-protein phosphatase [Bacilli bacterium]